MTASALGRYFGSYVDLVVVGQSARGPVALVAGSHSANFPYDGTVPWDNCLLLVGDVGYAYTGRTQGEALHVELDAGAPVNVATDGRVRFSGRMRRMTGGPAGALSAQVDLTLPLSAVRFPDRILAGAYNLLSLPRLPGLDWTPWDLRGERGTLLLDGDEVVIEGLAGAAEHGELTNLRAHVMAIKYDYLSVAKPGEDGYARTSFSSHALHPNDVFGDVVDFYLRATASADLTSERGQLGAGNPHGVLAPPTGNAAVLFEEVVDLGAASLERQMVKTVDASGAALYGLREIFTARPDAPAPPAARAHLSLSAAQTSLLLGALVALDVVLSLVALVFPDAWTRAFYGAPHHADFGELTRLGAVWAAFALVQGVALVRWRRASYWLAVVAGVRWTELFSDWAALLAADHVTWFGALGLGSSPLWNLLFGVLLIGTYKQLQTGALVDKSIFAMPWR